MRQLSRTDLTAYWRDIESSHTPADGIWRSRRLPLESDGRALVLAVDDLEERHLLVPVGTETVPTNTRSPLSVSADMFRFTDFVGELKGRYIDIHCARPSLNSQFDYVVDDVLSATEDSEDKAGIALATVNMWRRLFTNLATAPTLTYQEKIAAFGELTVLEELLENDADFQPEWWTGPDAQPHDFETDHCSVEVKSVGQDSRTITVHGLAQLAPTDGKPLYLIIRTVEEDPEGRTLGELLESVLSIRDTGTAIRDRAALLGISTTSQDTERFQVKETRIGSVEETFPRLTECDLDDESRTAVVRATYDLSLDALRPFVVRCDVPEILKEEQR